MEKVAFASDHAGYELKEVIKKYMEGKGYDVVDFGTDSEESCDYADYAIPPLPQWRKVNVRSESPCVVRATE